MSSALSSTVSSSAAAPSSSNACTTTTFSEFPVKDAACAVGGTSGYPDSYKNVLKGCCKDAPVESWGNNCALYCLSVDQSIAELQQCWQNGGVRPGDIFCNGVQNSTATSTPTKTNGGGAKEMGGSAASSTNSPGAAYAVVPQGPTKAGLGMLAVILGSTVFGALL